MNIIESILKNKIIIASLLIGLLLFILKSIGGISQCNGKYKIGSCTEINRVYN